MSNKVTSHPNYVEVVLVGDQTGSVTRQTIDEALVGIAKLEADHKAILVLADARQAGRTHLDTFEETVKAVAGHDFDRVAMFGPPGSLSEKLMNAMVRGLGEQRRLRYFTNRKQAEDWLLQQP
jgi:hypothetical protein